MVPGEASVGTAAPQATSAGGRHLAPAQCGTALLGLHEFFLGIPPYPSSGATRSAPFLPNRAVGGVLVCPPPKPWQHFEG